MSDNTFWLGVAAQTEAELDCLRVEFEETKRKYEERINELESQLLTANASVSFSGVMNNESIQ